MSHDREPAAGSPTPDSVDLRLSLEETVEQLRYVKRGASPREALEAAIALRSEIVPVLLDELSLAPVDVQRRIESEPKGSAYYLHTMAFHLLAYFREPLAFELMLDFYASDCDLAEDLSDFDLGVHLGAMLVRCYDGSDPRRLRLMVETQAFEATFRHSCLVAYHGLALTGRVEKAEVVAFAARLLDAIPPDAQPDSWYCWLALAAAELQAPSLRAPIDALFERGIAGRPEAPFLIATKADIDRIYADRPERIAAAVLSPTFFDHLVDRICRWPWFQPAPAAAQDKAERMYDALRYDMPYIRTLPKIGRNDLCLCGSGRKYKHCCLN